jgi:antitoxin FitA
MAQLLVRNVDEILVRKLKRRARERGVSAEEEHRRILAESLSRKQKERSSLVRFLLSPEGTLESDAELDLRRDQALENRDLAL